MGMERGAAIELRTWVCLRASRRRIWESSLLALRSFCIETPLLKSGGWKKRWIEGFGEGLDLEEAQVRWYSALRMLYIEIWVGFLYISPNLFFWLKHNFILTSFHIYFFYFWLSAWVRYESTMLFVVFGYDYMKLWINNDVVYDYISSIFELRRPLYLGVYL